MLSQKYPFLTQSNFSTRVDGCQCQRRFIFCFLKTCDTQPVGREPNQMLHCRLLQDLPCSHPSDCLAPPPFTLAAQFRLHIISISQIHFTQPSTASLPGVNCPCPLLARGTQTHTHKHTRTSRVITYVVTPGVTHINHVPPGVNGNI